MSVYYACMRVLVSHNVILRVLGHRGVVKDDCSLGTRRENTLTQVETGPKRHMLHLSVHLKNDTIMTLVST